MNMRPQGKANDSKRAMKNNKIVMLKNQVMGTVCGTIHVNECPHTVA